MGHLCVLDVGDLLVTLPETVFIDASHNDFSGNLLLMVLIVGSGQDYQ